MSIKSWTTIKIPKQLHKQIKDVIPYLGVPSVAEYVRQTVRESLNFCSDWDTTDSLFQTMYDSEYLERLRRDSLYVDNIKDRMEEAKHEEM